VTVERLHALKALGVRVAVDDFGTGYSSLAYLRRFPVDILKIDRAFISGLGRDTGDADIVRFLISLARSLGMQTIAEGVETGEQEEILRSLDCDQAQGYWISRPMQANDAVDWLRQNPPGVTELTGAIDRPVFEA
jgi:EAL domain-containing protein (putative c-di-GMP-specific phosphodiesterase class I)